MSKRTTPKADPVGLVPPSLVVLAVLLWRAR